MVFPSAGKLPCSLPCSTHTTKDNLGTKRVFFFKDEEGDFPGGPVAKLHTPNAGSLDSIPGQGTRSRMLQLRPNVAK